MSRLSNNQTVKIVIDLHTHCYPYSSCASLDYRTLIKQAKQEGIKTLSITNHDTIEGYPLFIKECQAQQIQLVPGIEITVINNGTFTSIPNKRTIHLLGIGIKLDSAAINQLLSSASEHPKPQEAIALIHRLGGVAIWAHPYRWGLSQEQVTEITEKLVSLGLDGIEVFHWANYENKEMLKHLLELVKNNHLMITIGSDRHHPLKENEEYFPLLNQALDKLEDPLIIKECNTLKLKNNQ